MHGRLLLETATDGERLRAEFGLVEVGAADEGRGGHGDADGAADVAQHVEEAGGVAHLLTGMVEVVMVASGTKTKLSAKPVSMMGMSSV